MESRPKRGLAEHKVAPLTRTAAAPDTARDTPRRRIRRCGSHRARLASRRATSAAAAVLS